MSRSTHFLKMPNATVEAQVRVIVAEILDVDEAAIHLRSRFREDLGADSLDLVMLITVFSRVFEAEIHESEVCQIQTIGETVAYLKRNLVTKHDPLEQESQIR